MNLLLGLILLQSIFQSYGQAIFSGCTTPDDQSGTCIYLKNCGYLYDIVQKTSISNTERQFLGNSQCSYEDGQVVICCANSRRRNQGQSPASAQPSQPINLGTRSNTLLPQAPNCGDNFGDKIVGGVNTGKKEFPWLALIEYTKPGNVIGHHCGGSLINNRYVLTAAHCNSPLPANWSITSVRLGEWDTTTNPDCTMERSGRSDCNDPYLNVPVTEITPHPEYNGNVRIRYHDIALLRLRDEVTFTSFISPVCLPTRPEHQNTIFLGRKMIVSGWGRTEQGARSNIKLKAEVDPVPTADCNKRYGRGTVSSNQICAGGVEGVDSCRGDSGGSLVMEEVSAGFGCYYLTGVVSYGALECGLDGVPGVYTLVPAYIDWIENNIRS